MNQEMWEQLTRARNIPALDRLNGRVQAFSPGDRVIFYMLAALVGIASLTCVYALEQSLLENKSLKDELKSVI